MVKRVVVLVAVSLKMAAYKESFVAQRVYEQIREQIQTGKLSLATPHEFVITKTNNELEP